MAEARADSGRRQHSRAEGFVFAGGFKPGIGSDDDGQRVTQRGEYFGTVAFGANGPGVVFH